MPNRIDTTKIQRIDLYTKVIESADAVPGTSREVLDKAVSNMRFDIEDINSKALNIIISLSLLNAFVIAISISLGVTVLFVIPPILTFFVLYLNYVRLEILSVDAPAKALTEGSDNVPPIAPNARVFWF